MFHGAVATERGNKKAACPMRIPKEKINTQGQTAKIMNNCVVWDKRQSLSAGTPAKSARAAEATPEAAAPTLHSGRINDVLDFL